MKDISSDIVQDILLNKVNSDTTRKQVNELCLSVTSMNSSKNVLITKFESDLNRSRFVRCGKNFWNLREGEMSLPQHHTELFALAIYVQTWLHNKYLRAIFTENRRYIIE